MITIYTSYYGRKDLPLERCLCISQGKPAWYKGERDLRLAPPWNMVKNHGMTPDEWRNVYYLQLNRYNPQDIADKLNGRIILCWEKPGERCHRHYVISWLQKCGIEVKGIEWGDDQQSLF